METTPYTTDDYPTERAATTPTRDRPVFIEGFVPVRLVAGVLLVLFGVLVLVLPNLERWVLGFGLVVFGIWFLVNGGYLGRPRRAPPPAEAPRWNP